MPQRPNIVLICADQMRWDCLSIAGHEACETPHLDFMAARGVRFTQAYTSVASCIAARAALLTGLSQRTHGRVGYRDGVTWDYPVTLPGELGKAGYQTVCVGKMHVHPQRSKMGFEKVLLHDGFLSHYGKDIDSDYDRWLLAQAGSDCGLFDHGIACNGWVARPWHLAEWMHPTYWAVSRGVEFLNQRDTTRPFFMFLSFVAPHPPHVPPQCYFDQYINQDLPAPPVGDWVDKIPRDAEQGRWNHQTQFGDLDKRALHRAQAAYYGQITQIDHQIGRLVEHLAVHKLLTNTVLLFVSDHGELLGDHHFFRKCAPYAGSVRVPMILHMPTGFSNFDHVGAGANKVAGAQIELGQTRDEVVELRDIMPTLLDIAGAPVPECVEGRSVLPLVRGEKPKWREYLHGEHWYADLSNHFIVDGPYKYIWFSQIGLEQLFDVAGDPMEMNDLADSPAHQDMLAKMRRRLIRELTGREEGYTDGKKLIVGRQGGPLLSSVKG